MRRSTRISIALPPGTFKRELAGSLRRRPRFRRPRKVRLSSRPIQDLISIDERPSEVADRTVPGHWEGDLLVGHANASALGTLVERTTRCTRLVPLKAKDAATVRQAFTRELRTVPVQLRRSLTYDQGPEMREHRLFTQHTTMPVYVAHPHCPWERGTNENTNGLLRQFFPKGTRFTQLSRAEIKRCKGCSMLGLGKSCGGIARPRPFTNCCARILNAHSNRFQDPALLIGCSLLSMGSNLESSSSFCRATRCRFSSSCSCCVLSPPSAEDLGI